MTSDQNIEVFYDGDCPICRMEVNWYERMDKRDSISWLDITKFADRELPNDKSREELLGKFHVRDADGNWFIGVDAFARIWRNLPYLNRGALLFSVPGIRGLTEVAYRGFLKWQRWHRRRRHLEAAPEGETSKP